MLEPTLQGERSLRPKLRDPGLEILKITKSYPQVPTEPIHGTLKRANARGNPGLSLLLQAQKAGTSHRTNFSPILRLLEPLLPRAPPPPNLLLRASGLGLQLPRRCTPKNRSCSYNNIRRAEPRDEGARLPGACKAYPRIRSRVLRWFF